jgi:hypothetical protein
VTPTNLLYNVIGTELKQGNSIHEFADPLLDALTVAYRETAVSHHG